MKENRKNVEALTTGEKPLYFHIGRGGKFYNQGFVTFVDVKPFYEVVDKALIEDANIKNCDENGRYCKPYIASCNGCEISTDNPNGLYGMLNYDEYYNTDIILSVDDAKGCKRYEEAIKRAVKSGKTISEDIIDYLEIED